MGLLNTKFESETDTATAEHPATETATAAAPVVVSSATAVTMVAPNTGDVIGQFKGAMPVDYNTLAQVKCTNGNFVEREANKVMGDTIVFELLSWQDSYVVSANDDKAPKETLKFSNDNVTCTDGTPVATHLNDLKNEGWSKASVKHRLTVVGAVQSASKTSDFNGVLVQFDLSPESRVLFQRYQATTAYGVRTGRVDPNKATTIKASARLVTKGSNTYTVADMSIA